MDFFGREAELEELKDAFSGNRFEAALIYGRRRVGKTELISRALAGIRDSLIISCECKRVGASANLEHLSQKVSAALNYPEDYTFSSFDALLEAVFAEAEKQKIVFVIDEFSFLLKEDPSVDSSLAVAIDAHKASSQLKLVLSGSYIDLMAQLVDATSPLYGRFSRIILLKPFDYFTASCFYPRYSAEDKVLMYSVFGGVPYFNSLIDPSRPALENILRLVVRKDSILEHEISEMLLNETNKISGMNVIIELVGRGVVKYSDIVERVSQDSNINPAYALSRLQEMGILRKVEPINAKGNKKRTSYAISDNLVHFYYRYVFRYLSERNFMDARDFYDEFIEQDLKATYLPMKFEQISAEGIARLSRLHRVEPPIHEVGTYSFDDQKAHINRQFDVVTKDRNGYTSYECKYTDAPLRKAVVEEEEAQTRGLDIDFYRLGFVSRSGFSKDVDSNKYVLITLDDLYE